MKKGVFFVATGLLPILGWGQGQVSFSNVGDGVNAPVTHAETGEALAGGWKAQLWAGSSETGLSPVSDVIEFLSDGYFTGGSVTIDSVAPGESPFFQVVAWEGPAASLAEAQGAGGAWGRSNVFSTSTSPASVDGAPPTPPRALEGLESFMVQSSAGGVIGDFVWADLNRNGLQDEGEPGMGGVEIRVLDCATSEILEVVFSDDNGNWALSGELPAASYLEVVTPEGFSLTAWAVGENRAIDSDIDPFSGRSLCIVTDCGDEDSLCVSVNIDIGFTPLPSLPPLPDLGLVEPGPSPEEPQLPEESPDPDANEPSIASMIATVSGPGFWKRQTRVWPVDELEIGGVIFSRRDAIRMMSNGADKSLTLFRQVVAAKLNVARGAEGDCIEDVLAEADAWLALHGPVPGNISGNSEAWQVGEPLATALDHFNAGEACAPAEHVSLNPVELSVGFNNSREDNAGGNSKEFRIRVKGEPGRTFLIQKTSDFVTWEDVVVVENAFGISEALTTNREDDPDSFFRVVPEKGPAKRPKPKHNRVGTFREVKANQSVELEPIVYEGDLIIAGAKNTISGTILDSERYTVIAGNLEVLGASNTVSNLTVLGDVILRGNKNELHNVDYQGDVLLEGGPQNNVF